MSGIYKVSGKKFALPTSQEASRSLSEARWVVRPGGWLVLEFPDGTRRRLALHEARGQLAVAINGRLYSGVINEESRHRGTEKAEADADLTAQFPGKVRKVLVSAGAKVAEGDSLVLVEAMKMEFTIKAPADGKVTKILVTEGQQLSPGDRFLDFEVNGGASGG